jgi:hypothetical protein
LEAAVRAAQIESISQPTQLAVASVEDAKRAADQLKNTTTQAQVLATREADNEAVLQLTDLAFRNCPISGQDEDRTIRQSHWRTGALHLLYQIQ